MHIPLLIAFLFCFQASNAHNLSLKDRKNMSHEHKTIKVQNVTAIDCRIKLWDGVLKKLS